jgi:hypothetical protein
MNVSDSSFLSLFHFLLFMKLGNTADKAFLLKIKS